MKYTAVIFDLDGTLVDSLADIAAAANCVLAAEGFPVHDVQAYRTFVGDGVTMLMTRALPKSRRDEPTIRRCADQFGPAYHQSWDEQTRPYPGIPELLGELGRQQVKLGVLSNKPHEFAVQMIDRYFGRGTFAAVLGQRDEVPRKPDPAAAHEIARQLDVPPDKFVFLGDSAVDMQTARAAGMYAVGALWGFRSRAELLDSGAQAVIKRPAELIDVLGLANP